MTTSIEWARNADGSKGETWNPVTGCTKVSPGCDHCYAETITERFHGKGSFEQVVMHPERLAVPLHWRKPRTVFVNSMSDLFHPAIPLDFFAQVWDVMVRTPQHTYQILTKRPARMPFVLGPRGIGFYAIEGSVPRPQPNIWLGTSVEDQERAGQRIPHLVRTPAAVRFLSCEPLLGPVSLPMMAEGGRWRMPVDWVIVGGESGPKCRPMDLRWARSLRDQCVETGTAFFLKQLGGWPDKRGHDKAVLDGRTWTQMPDRAASEEARTA